MRTRTSGKHAALRQPRGRHAARAHRDDRVASVAGSAPRVVGALALAVATGGALTVPADPVGSPSAVGGTGAAGDTGAAGALMAFEAEAAASAVAPLRSSEPRDASRPREQRLSRDSSRQALSDAAGGTLRRPAGAQARGTNAEIARLAADAEKAAAEIVRNAWHLPIAAGVYRLTGRFGECGSLWAHCHTGLDFAAPAGTPVEAVAGGVVTGTGWAGAYGNRLVLTLEDGTEIWYCHLTSFVADVGQRVAGGQVVGLVGSTGNSTGPHLHLEVRPGGGDAVDPYSTLSVKGQQP